MTHRDPVVTDYQEFQIIKCSLFEFGLDQRSRTLNFHATNTHLNKKSYQNGFGTRRSNSSQRIHPIPKSIGSSTQRTHTGRSEQKLWPFYEENTEEKSKQDVNRVTGFKNLDTLLNQHTHSEKKTETTILVRKSISETI